MKDSIIDKFLKEFDKPKRVTKGRDTTKNYHKITISVNQADKEAIQQYAQKNDLTVSALIKVILKEKNII